MMYEQQSPFSDALFESELFGEYLVARGVITEFELSCGLQLQDHLPAMDLDECLARLGYIDSEELQSLLWAWSARGDEGAGDASAPLAQPGSVTTSPSRACS